VTTTKTDSEVVELVLASFQKELRTFRRSLLARMADRLLFRPRPKPVVAYARQFSAADEREAEMSGPVLGVWRITPDTVERMPTDFSTLERHRYAYTYFSFTLPGKSGFGVWASRSGPLCGIGYRYRVSADSIEMAPMPLWIS
jgi:hypothetical protein